MSSASKAKHGGRSLISVVIPAYNEEGNIAELFREVRSALSGKRYEVVAVDDGSTDRTLAELRKAAGRRVRVVSLGAHRGKCFALYRGIRASKGDIIATIDSDLQNDPRDIPVLLAVLREGFDFVNGRRRDRKDGPVKRASSAIGNRINNILTGVGLHDNTCPVKVFRRECVIRVGYFNNYHRFLPFIAKAQGFRMTEAWVRSRPRVSGRSKYGVHNRILGNLLTIIMLRLGWRRLLEWS